MTDKASELRTTDLQTAQWRAGLTAYMGRCDDAGKLARFLSDALKDLDTWKRRALIAERALENLAILTTTDAGKSIFEEAERQCKSEGIA